MGSNEGNEDKNLETSIPMEVSEPSMQDKQAESEPIAESSEELVLEDTETSGEIHDASEKTTENVIEKDTGKEIEKENKEENEKENERENEKENEKENKTISESPDIVTINTSQNDSLSKKESETKENDKSTKALGVSIDAESTKMSTSTSPQTVPSPTLVESQDTTTPKEGKRKRKSTIATRTSDSPAVEQQNGGAPKRKKLDSNSSSSETAPVPSGADGKTGDRYCWRCHKEPVEAVCSACPRSWHRRCMGGAPPLTATDWLCPECTSISSAETAETRSPAMASLTAERLCMMLKHVVERMKDQHGSEPFLKAVDLAEVPNYLDYVIKPMDLSLLEANVRAKLYGSTDAFMADAKWIQHNCIVFNTYTSKLTNTAKQMLKVARQEVSEIEACPDCFSHGRNLPRPLPTWFIEPCRRPHPIVWAKLKGFPFWPAKALPRLNGQGLVDVRFFGEHDRAWVSPKDIYLYSKEPPAQLPKKKKLEMDQCLKEVEEHSRKLEAVFGDFRYAPPKIPYDPHDVMQIKVMLPKYDPIKNEKIPDPPKAERVTKSTAGRATKTPAAKADRKSLNNKNVAAESTNGVVGSQIETRKLVRKKRSLEPPTPVNKPDPVPETPAAGPKIKNKSPPATTPVTNNVNSNNDQVKLSVKSLEPSVVLGVADKISPQKKVIIPVKKIIKRIKLTKDVDEKDQEKSTVLTKFANGKPSTVVHSLLNLNNLKNKSETVVKTVSPGQKPKTIYIQQAKKSGTLVPATAKIITKSPQENRIINKTVIKPQENKVVNKTAVKTLENKVVNKTTIKSPEKEPNKCQVNHVQKAINKDDLVSNKPMTAIPIPSKKDQTKAVYLLMNSKTTESATHFNDKESRINPGITTIKQEPKDDVVQPKLTITRKPGKARKSFPSKPVPFQQSVLRTSFPQPKPPSSTASTSDAMVYIPGSSNSDPRSTYELPPPEAGPVTARIHRNSKELANRVAQLIADTIKDAAETNGLGPDSPVNRHEATIHYLKLRMERMKWEHQQEILEIKHNNDLVLREMKAGMEVERYRALQDARRDAEIDKMRCIEETKRKQWCAACGREAMFYCCWNTAYCDYPCQQKHWANHVATCAQKNQSTPQKPVAPQQHNSSNDIEILSPDST